MTTPDLSPDRLAQMREVAEVATPGWWGVTYPGSRTIEAADGKIVVDAFNDGIGAGVVEPCDEVYLATFDPPTVLALLAEVERLRAHECVSSAALASSSYQLGYEAGVADERNFKVTEIDRLRATVQRVEAMLHEPVMSDWAKRYWSGRHDSHRPMMAVTLEDYRDRALAALRGDS